MGGLTERLSVVTEPASKNCWPCPCCMRDIRSFADFAAIRVLQVERFSLPEFIAGKFVGGYRGNKSERQVIVNDLGIVPESIKQMFEADKYGFIAYNGRVYRRVDEDYFEVRTDVLPVLKPVAESQQVQGYLSRLEGFVGRNAVNNDIFPQWLSEYQKIPAPFIFRVPDSEAELILDDERMISNRGNFTIQLRSASGLGHMNLSRVHYTGILLRAPVNPKKPFI